ncbi:MAG TPA: NAD-binding protein [Spirochaetota bacterium]|nr:NAD-binding protein [Spirochaetota bacterium]
MYRSLELKKLRLSITLLLGTITFGTFGYHIIEGMPFFDSFYMTMITISTVGFSEVKQLSIAGRIVTILIITSGVTISAYTIGTLLRMFIEGELRKTFGRRKMEKMIKALKNHYIICGYGRIGSLICTELKERNIPFVVIENDPSSIENLEKEHYLYLSMDATTEEALIAAGITYAKGLVTAVMSDADNVYIILTARGLNSDIFILSRASNENAEEKLKRAGATRVVLPYQIGGRRMAHVLVRPTVVDFLDVAMMDSELGLSMEEAHVKGNSSLVGKNLIESNLRKDYGVIIVAIKKVTGEMIFNPTPVQKLDAGDDIVVLGKRDDLIRMNKVI